MATPASAVAKNILLTTKPASVRISELRNDRSTAYAFKNFNKADFLLHLQMRIASNPRHNVNQSRSSLCGPAAVLYVILIQQKDAFVNFAINLFQYGEAYLGKLHVKPGQDTKNMKPANLMGMSPVDWVVLASLRDSQNSLLSYDKVTDQVAGITFPHEVETWCKQIGFRQVVNKTNHLFTKGIDNLLQAQQYLQSGHSICLFINLDVLDKVKYRGVSYTPNHWVVLTSDIVVDGNPLNQAASKKLVQERIDYYSDKYDDNNDLVFDATFKHDIRFEVYTWGRRNHPIGAIPNSGIDLNGFLDYYYGFVAVKSLIL